MPKRTKKVPRKACFLNMEQNDKCSFSFSEVESEDKSDVTKLSILGYSGGVIKDHWWWGNLVISTEGMSFPKEKYPILRDHNTDRRIGFSSKPTIQSNGALLIETTDILDTEDAHSFVKDSKAGFPFQASISVQPTKVRFLEENESMMVNGFEFTGPGTVFVESIYREVSACVFGWDSNTSSSAFADNGEDIFIKETNMDFNEEWKKQDPEGYAEFCKKIADEATAPLNAKLSEKDATIASLTKDNETNKTAKTELETRLARLERDAELRTENDRRSMFSGMVNEAGADLPEHLRSKFAKMFNIEDYRYENGDIDKEKLTTALSKEINEWKAAFSDNTPSIIGGGRQPEQSTTEFGMSEDEYKKFAGNCGVNV